MCRVLWLGFLIILCAACAPQTPSKSANPAKPTLHVGQRSISKAPEGPVRVAYFAPIGEAPANTQITVAFDRPMHALDAAVDAAGVVSMEPDVSVRARWVGSQTVVLEPLAALPSATSFKVRVAPGTRALDGNALPDELVFAFATPRPKVVSGEPYDGSMRELPARAFELHFNQAVSPERVRQALSVESEHSGKSQPLDVEVLRPDPGDLKRVRVQPRKPLPMGARAVLRLSAELRGDEGPRTMGEAFSTAFSVYGTLKFATYDPCVEQRGGCNPAGGVSIAFSNPVKIKDALRVLRFEPPLAEPLAAYDEDYESEYVYLSQPLAPLIKYSVRVVGDLVDVFGNHFKDERPVSIRTSAYEPAAYFPVEGEILPYGARATMPVRISNLAAPQLVLFALAAEEIEPLASYRLAEPKRKGISVPLAKAGPVERRMLEADPSPALHQGKGVFLAQIKDPKHGAEVLARTLLAVTDLAPTLKLGARSGLVWVTRLSSAESVAGARVRLTACGNTLADGQTDGQGYFRFQLSKAPECELFALAEKDGDLSFTHQYAGVGPWELTQHAHYGDDGQGPVDAFLFAERGVYRPGETMRLKGILRARGQGTLEPASGAIKLVVSDSQGQELEKADLALNDFGTFSRDVRIPGSVPLGPISVTVQHGEQSFGTSAEVAEYRPAELEVEVRPERESAVRGETVKFRVSAHYLFGAPLADQRVVWSARRREHFWQPEGERLEGFVFSDETRWFEDTQSAEETTLAGAEAKLDHNGELTLQVPAELDLSAGVAALELEANAYGLGGASAAGRALVTITPAAFLVGIKPEKTLVPANEPFSVELATAKLSGELARGVSMDVTLERRTYANELKSGEAGRTEYVWTHHDEVVQKSRVSAKDGTASLTLSAKQPGLHFLRAQAKDAAGRKVRAALPIYVSGAGEASWQRDGGPVIALKSDRARYRLGQSAKILVASPFPEAEALISVEREGVMSVERRHLSGKAVTLDIPIDERFVPNAFVTVMLVRPHHSSDIVDPATPDYRVGTVELATDVSARELRVKVRPDAAEKRPGEPLDVAFEVRDGAGKAVASELTVFAVDEGVLALTGYRTPKPFDALYARRALAVWTADARAQLARVTPGASEKGGDEGGGGGEGVAMRRDFDALAFYAPNVLTDAEGRAKISFRLPDSLTKYRIMAVAASRGSELGSGEASVRTRKPLMLRPALPRAVRVGDAFQAGVVVHNETARDLQVSVRAEVTGLLADGDLTRSVLVPKQRALEVRFPLHATQAGSARMRFLASAGGETDALELVRAVIAPTVLENVSTTGKTGDSASEGLGALEGLRPDVGGLEVRVSTSALAQLEAPVKSLLEYPYACTEQLASRLVGMAALERLAKRGVLQAEGLEARVQQTLGELERHQRADGGFGLWSGTEQDMHPPLTAFLTGYALLSMDELKRAGFRVSGHAAESARTWLGQYMRGERTSESTGLRGADRVFALYALARTGHLDASYAGTFFERRGELSLASRVELAQVLSAAKDPRAPVLEQEILAQLRVTADEAHLESNLGDDYDVIMASDVRATAQLVLLLTAEDEDHPLLPRLARWLSNARELDGTWGSTQQNAWGLLALADYLEATESASPDFTASARLDARSLGSVQLAGRAATQTWTVPMRELPGAGASVTLHKQGPGTLHYALRLSYARSALPTKPEERGVYVERQYERIDPAALARGDLAGEASDRAVVGDYVRVTLRVAVPSTRRFVVIEDPLPTGLEPVNLGWLNESSFAAGALEREQGPVDHSEQRDTHVMFSATQLEPGLYRYEYLARASTPGKYVVPPASAAEMYHPETFGRTAAASFEVSAR